MPKTKKQKYVSFTYHKRRVKVFLDSVLFFRFIRNLHGRFWGLAAVFSLLFGFSLCFLIRPDLLTVSTALSDFGNDVRTAPYFAGSVFFAAYGLWRWRNYLSRTWKRSMPVTGLITLTIIGLYLVALMPVSWRPWPYKIHFFGVMLTGISMLATVVIDSLLSKTRRSNNTSFWRLIGFCYFSLMVVGGFLTFGSSKAVGWYNVALLGELLLIAGYGLWVATKTYEGEGNRSILSKLLKNLVLID